MTTKGTQIVQCDCKNAYQDRRYGSQMRVANLTTKGKSPTSDTYRCSSCERMHDVKK